MLKLIIIVLLPTLLLFGLGAYLFACIRKKNLFDPALLPRDCPRNIYRRQCLAGGKALEALNGKSLTIRSKDGKNLRARLYENSQNESFIILVHGYHSYPAYDFGLIAHYYLALGYGVLLITQRSHEESDGMLITYGAKESEDLCLWVGRMVELFPGCKIILHGVSMGGATVMLATERDLPKNVQAIVCDCAYTSPFDEICHVAKTSMNLPRATVYAANIWSVILTGVSLKRPSVTRAGARCPLPKLYIHGDADNFVPFEMGLKNYKEAMEPKRFVTVKGAGHAMSFFTDEELVAAELARFARENLP